MREPVLRIQNHGVKENSAKSSNSEEKKRIDNQKLCKSQLNIWCWIVFELASVPRLGENSKTRTKEKDREAKVENELGDEENFQRIIEVQNTANFLKRTASSMKNSH